MKRSGRKAGSGDAGTASDTEAPPAFVLAEDPAAAGGFHIDGVQAMQAPALAIAAIGLVWIVLRYIIHAI